LGAWAEKRDDGSSEHHGAGDDGPTNWASRVYCR
jgi:hypothetical protein